MTAAELQQYLHTHIPLSAAMQVMVQHASADMVELQAPLEPNVNHRGTAFGGSIATLATLAGWSLLRIRLDGMEPLPHLVIQHQEMHFSAPIIGPLLTRARFPAGTDWAAFLAMLENRGRARLQLTAEVLSGTQPAARMEGLFVALKV
ncbi:MAG: thioesterase [Candidatus Dactylopiibacterium carminicum]|uniref:Thioesterase n=1 Tax=Candidatus Dactylopiibacterium carminicum TaxID=857335 RepID=A0A272END5_9RHOO|nr:YiiD C-terminal domain-containing protein [Candidatus Dactylopiibacterium carminicum]KAF7598067.1 thioesterase [Candidatus Dactylopiibacterium carminicum]PAS91634.1 MAG: thioesterase [Candidatus Dactylopiibacterium carminicum]PAS93606.1 MAG: thioesterase [Candidatus Dactylopiibacterium carminicum]PAS96509.1 MAG: hypothetical protein BSR46_15345 [Candidatus Dactylopiibacterium carminicum]